MTPRQTWVAIVAALAVSAAADLALGTPYAFPAYWAVFGLVGAALLIGVAKGALKGLLQRTESYYDAGGGDG